MSVEYMAGRSRGRIQGITGRRLIAFVAASRAWGWSRPRGRRPDGAAAVHRAGGKPGREEAARCRSRQQAEKPGAPAGASAVPAAAGATKAAPPAPPAASTARRRPRLSIRTRSRTRTRSRIRTRRRIRTRSRIRRARVPAAAPPAPIRRAPPPAASYPPPPEAGAIDRLDVPTLTAYPAAPPPPRREIVDPQGDRVVLLPTATTHPAGTFYFSNYELIIFQAGYAFTDRHPAVGDGDPRAQRERDR